MYQSNTRRLEQALKVCFLKRSSPYILKLLSARASGNTLTIPDLAKATAINSHFVRGGRQPLSTASEDASISERSLPWSLPAFGQRCLLARGWCLLDEAVFWDWHLFCVMEVTVPATLSPVDRSLPSARPIIRDKAKQVANKRLRAASHIEDSLHKGSKAQHLSVDQLKTGLNAFAGALFIAHSLSACAAAASSRDGSRRARSWKPRRHHRRHDDREPGATLWPKARQVGTCQKCLPRSSRVASLADTELELMQKEEATQQEELWEAAEEEVGAQLFSDHISLQAALRRR